MMQDFYTMLERSCDRRDEDPKGLFR